LSARIFTLRKSRVHWLRPIGRVEFDNMWHHGTQLKAHDTEPERQEVISKN
jgi:hypothetical protein